ncbi:MAG: GTP-binding protein TypA [Omnitrophica bacterium RIFCSPLOWO2_12_FULL_44_17]|uniref:Large ribosomal subunit assembly factor BipA n=1 Tax=Candidatus Danuiimicrobium aquiferis TaxID=1801832 RepID=A0A1G1KZG9_9BACT|nr:MAG: GTP-binding protein TypA [Omnitrophica bacterium RIFCSPHIGHO2_02_FULL_45_28]OGW89113.1 MAG: GTP-binding protein TypA [Omnitrophica bacterium RIFCSPHIGHO2_12_FULL_44_12]OGW98298.1 MAG: GTP-binding protein TypA [Omnitrophica bacterium RIFCSPLOWO2_12_FULL_44_17]OGX02892.1 MAG: GTP-binding protein TypA [Omnitrophica bacterium RIFCSPLOWO2_02_FULL_44_11]
MPTQKRRRNVRNIAIVAHVDHGKTTLVDALLKQSGAYKFHEGETTVMDSNPLEKERGITIFSKNASFIYKDTLFNIVDTPGHADFGSEVERILKMVDGVLLLVDAFDGPMPQTKFVLRKSLELHLKPILVVNKVDRPGARPHEVVDLTFDLFCELNATDEQLDFPIVYASAKEGWASLEPDESSQDMKPLLDTILHRVLPPIADPELPFQMLVTMLDYDSYVGRIAIGRISHGKVKVGDLVALVKRDGRVGRGKVTKILKYKGLKRIEAESAEAGDIASIAGIEEVHVADTLTDPIKPEAISAVKIDEPTISMNFAHNSSPLAGKDGGRFLTSRHIRERLMHEAMMNVGIRVEEVPGEDRFKLSGRGELHLSILIETMRREGYEIEVSRPEVIIKEEGGEKLEPVEEVVIEVDPGYQGAVIEALGTRKAEMKNMLPSAVGTIRMEFLIPSRGLLGFRSELLMITRGTGIMYQNFYDYQKFKGEIAGRQRGVQISQGSGQAVAYALWGLQERGEIFVQPGRELYEGMIIGVNNKGCDLVVNAIREKKLSNMRAAGSDEAIQLTPPREMTLEFALEFIERDELVEVTPKNIRLRKRYLNENERKRAQKQTQQS